MMDDLSGYEVLRTLKADSNTSTIPFIFLSARTDKADQRFGMELGADDYLTKPFTPDDIFKAINIRLSKHDEIALKTEQKLNELRLSIATSLPHELRTPLNGIMASTQLLMEYYDNMERDEVLQIHESIYSSAKRLNRLILNYLSFAELELIHRDPMRLEAFRKSSITDNSSVLISEIFMKTSSNYKREKDLSINLDNASLQIFNEHLRKICEELADNAFKFSDNGSVINVNGKKNSSNYILTIKDFGHGMTSEQMTKIGAYVQFDRRIYEQQGSGLGLVIVKRLLQIYGGVLEFDSVANEYTIAKVQIPLNI
jgi:signal transduction histidine kinase